MWKQLLSWTVFLTIAGFLAGCSGGGAFSDEGSSSSSGSSSGTSTSGATATTLPVAKLEFVGQTIVDVGKTTAITVKTLDSNDNPVGNAPLTFSSNAALGGLPTATGLNGQASFQVTANAAGPVTVSVGSGSVTQTLTLYYGARVSSELQGNNQLANGTAAVYLIVRIQDHNGLPIAGVPVKLAFSLGSFALSSLPPDAVTDNNGVVIAAIVDTVAEVAQVTPIVGGGAQAPKEVRFTAVGLTTPHSVTLTVSKNNALADGKDTAQLMLVARDASGTPIAGVPVKISVSSGSAAVTPATGQTGDNGVLLFTVADPVVETVKVTATAGTVNSETKDVVFVKSAFNVAEVIINVSGNNQPADGASLTTLTVYARDAARNPVLGAPVAIQLSSGTAKLNPATGTTDPSGRFVATLTDSVPETFEVTGVVANMPSAPKSVTFVATPKDDTTPPGQVTLTISPNNQPADGKSATVISAIVRSTQNVPMADKDVVFTSDSGTAVFTSAAGKTNAGGVFTTNVVNSVPETFFVEASSQGVSSGRQAVTFKTLQPLVDSVQATVSNNNQPADGKSAATFTVVARDATGQPVVNAPVALIFSHGSATPAQATGVTDAGGKFATAITDTIPETVLVSATVSDKRTPSAQAVTFVASSSDSPPAIVTTTVNKATEVADGKAEVEVTVIARDANNVPMKNIGIQLSSTSGTAILTPASGNTGDNGVFRAKVTNTKAESVTITPTANGVKGQAVTIAFTTPVGAVPSEVTVNLINNGANADNTDTIQLNVVARNKGVPVPNAPVQVQIEGNTVEFKTPATGVTDAMGMMTVSVVSGTPGRHSVTATVAGIQNTSAVSIEFVIPGGSAKLDKLDLKVTPSTSGGPIADGQDTAKVQVIALNKDGAPVSGQNVKLTSTSSTAKFGKTEGTTGTNGVFETTLSNTVPEAVTVTATAPGTTQTKAAGVTFVQLGGSAPPPADATLELLASSPTLASEGNPTGVTLTARIKTKDNNPFAGAAVRFEATSGDIQVIKVDGAPEAAGVTTTAGIAKALLTTVGNPLNRTIQVTAKSGSLTKTITVEVNGTNVTISGPTSATLNSKQSYAVFVKDSAGKGLGSQKLAIVSAQNNTISNKDLTTDGSGRAEFELQITATANADTITATLVPDPQYAAVTKATEGKVSLTISTDNFTLLPDATCEAYPKTGTDLNVPLGQTCFLVVKWLQNNSPLGLQPINISTTRGQLVDDAGNVLNGVVTTGRVNGEARFGVKADNAGPATITAKSQAADGPSAAYSLYFVSKDASLLDLQANPASLGVNQPGADSEQSEIIAVVRDAKNNLVKNMRVDFLLEDVTGGKISPSSAVTDQFGRASTVYIAGSSSSASNGVKITARTETGLSRVVTLTVAQRGVFVALGTGNTIEELNETTYRYPYNVLVTDINGAAVAGAEVTLAVQPLRYYKGYHEWNGVAKIWVKIPTLETAPLANLTDPDYRACLNEDRSSGRVDFDFNGILDNAESDYNGNNRLDPGNVVAVEPGTVVTDKNGFAAFNILYGQENAHWVDVRLIARAVVAGTEDADQAEFELSGAAEDYIVQTTSPPGAVSPFGIGGPATISNDPNTGIETRGYNNASCRNTL